MHTRAEGPRQSTLKSEEILKPRWWRFRALTGLYDIHGVLRYCGRDRADCLAYADLFALNPGSFTLASLERDSCFAAAGSDDASGGWMAA